MQTTDHPIAEPASPPPQRPLGDHLGHVPLSDWSRDRTEGVVATAATLLVCVLSCVITEVALAQGLGFAITA